MTDGRAKGVTPAPERFTVTASDGTALPLDAYRPEKRPVGCVLLIHGGGWRSGGAETLARQAAYFASRGALAVCCSYRLLSETTDVCDGLDDCARALRFVRERLLPPYGALPVTVLGDSAGGYYACCLGCTAIVNRTGTDVKRAEYVVDLNGITDLTGKWKYGCPPRTRRWPRRIRRGTTYRRTTRRCSSCTATATPRWRSPTRRRTWPHWRAPARTLRCAFLPTRRTPLSSLTTGTTTRMSLGFWRVLPTISPRAGSSRTAARRKNIRNVYISGYFCH